MWKPEGGTRRNHMDYREWHLCRLQQDNSVRTIPLPANSLPPSSTATRTTRATGLEPSNGKFLNQVRGRDKITDYAKMVMQWAVGNGLIKGKSENLLDPQVRQPARRFPPCFTASLRRLRRCRRTDRPKIIEKETDSPLRVWAICPHPFFINLLTYT